MNPLPPVLPGLAGSDEPGPVGDYVRAALAPNTRRAYQADLAQFVAWGGLLPATDRMIAEYLAAHAGNLALATLQRRLATLGRAHSGILPANPVKSEIVRLVMQGIRRIHGSAQRQVAPLLWADLEMIIASLGQTTVGLRDRALFLVGFAGAFRRSELVAIDCKDLDWQADGLLVMIRRSKTDPFGKGRDVAIPVGANGFCPVQALKKWLEAAEICEGPVFRSVTRSARVLPHRLSAESVARIVKEKVVQIGRDPTQYSGHSLRAGFATTAASLGVQTWKIRRQTGHRSQDVLGRYLRSRDKFTDNAASAVICDASARSDDSPPKSGLR